MDSVAQRLSLPVPSPDKGGRFVGEVSSLPTVKQLTPDRNKLRTDITVTMEVKLVLLVH